MLMFNIYYLKFTQYAIDTLPLTKRLFNEHYVLSYKTKFFVLTSKPITGLKSTFIHTPNIEGQVYKKQYVIENAHTFNLKFHFFEYTAKGTQYLIDHQEKFKPILEALVNLPQ